MTAQWDSRLLAAVLLVLTVLSAHADPGIELYKQGRLHEAREALERAVSDGYAGITEMALLGSTYTRLGMYGKARQILSEARQLYPEAPQVLNALAMLEFAAGNYEEAYRWLDRAQNSLGLTGQDRQDLVGALINRSVRLYQQGDLNRAASALEEARTLEPGNATVIPMLIQLYREQGRQDKLIELYRAFIALHPENPQLHAELGMLLDEAGDSAAAETAFLQAERYGTEEPYPYFYLAGKTAGRHGAANTLRSRLHLAIGKAVRKVSMLRVQAAGVFQRQQGELSAEELESLQEFSRRTEQPKQILQDSIALLKASYGRQGGYEQDLRRLADWYPHSLELRCALGRFLEEEGRHEEALGHWRALLSDFSAAAEAHIGMARSLQALGQREAARVAFLRARDIEPENSQVYRALQQLSPDAQEKRELLQLYTEIYHRERTNPALMYAMAELEEQLGRKEQATVYRLRAAELEQGLRGSAP
jgi:tetratricopeptide (TPR) repeat protein